MSFKLKEIKSSDHTSNNDAQMTTDSGGVAGESTGLLAPQTNNCNGEVDSERGQRNGGGPPDPLRNNRVCKELNKKVFWKVRIWMAVVFIIILIPVVVVISFAICAATYVDKDEVYDSSLFTIPQYFNGSFQMSSVSLQEGADIDLQQKLADLYKSSPALGRYFSEAKIYPSRNASNVVNYQLRFVLPEDQREELRNFTLSNEMVQSVFRQFLYDQDQDSASTYIIPVSLIMSSRH
ncbi:TPA-induced transmembrane-like protein [Oryzias melastigma]|uniref:TPA-induced transmembrane-like protein n=2 Tax=Oryzias melastigma TaxID=30732 RepID=A0A834CDW1_ORYME|nr:TPA-induced transmembrane protein homolog [Oryzias melastigma]KAF6724901.1 TPA-induced transmembrane-like protein [Oryzias melastigma]